MVEEAMSGESGRESGKKLLRHAKIPCVACTQSLPVETVPHPAAVRNVYHTVDADHIHLPGSSCLGRRHLAGSQLHLHQLHDARQGGTPSHLVS